MILGAFHGMLTTLLSNRLTPVEKEDILEQGIEQELYSLVTKGLLKPEDAAAELNVTVEEFIDKMKKQNKV